MQTLAENNGHEKKRASSWLFNKAENPSTDNTPLARIREPGRWCWQENAVIDSWLPLIGVYGYTVYGVLTRFANKNTQVTSIGQERIASYAGVSRNRVAKALRDLEAYGLIIKSAPVLINDGKQERWVTSYLLLRVGTPDAHAVSNSTATCCSNDDDLMRKSRATCCSNDDEPDAHAVSTFHLSTIPAIKSIPAKSIPLATPPPSPVKKRRQAQAPEIALLANGSTRAPRGPSANEIAAWPVERIESMLRSRKPPTAGEVEYFVDVMRDCVHVSHDKMAEIAAILDEYPRFKLVPPEAFMCGHEKPATVPMYLSK